MKKIALTQGRVALVDDSDYDYLNQWKWHVRKDYHTYYAIRNVGAGKHKQRPEHMHRVILGLQPDDKQITDHIDGDGLNNQQSNLRACTQAQNLQSSRKQIDGTSKYKGVDWCHCARKWRSRIWVNEKSIYLGCFDSEVDAAVAYNTAALKHFGGFALLNAP